MERINVSTIHEGICFSEPVFFDDGKNMFLPAGKQAKPYHVAALEQWKIPFLLTEGREIDPKDYVAPVAQAVDLNSFSDVDIDSIDDLEDLGEVEEL